MEYLIKTIGKGAEIAGDQKHLEAELGIARGYLSDVKAGRKGLQIEACFKLAEITGADLVRVIAESEAITAKKPEKVEFWKKKLEALAACLVLGVVTNFVTPAPCEASQSAKVIDYTVYYVKLRRKLSSLKKRFLQGLKMTIPETLRRFGVPRVDHVPA